MVRQAQLVFTAGNDLFRLCRDLNPNTCALEAGFLRAADLRARADSLPEYGPVTLFRSARITRNKGTEYLLDALGQLVSAGHDVRLKLAGGCRQPAYEAALQADCRRAGLAARVDWLGHVPFGPALFDQYASATVGVLSSLSEGFPDFIREAWAFSLPVVVARLPGLSPPVVPDENAVVTEPASGAALADGVARLLADGALRRRIIAAGFRIAQACVLEQRSRVIAERILKAVEAFHTGSATSAASSEG
jgi:glycosyltransferase involved in cell wall biosynthesis